MTEEQFMEACEKASANPLHKKIVDQITAVDNFIAFKKLMVKRNAELNEQALAMLSKKDKKEKKDKTLASLQTLPTPTMTKEQ